MKSRARNTYALLGLVAVTGFGILSAPRDARASERPNGVLAVAYDDDWKERDKREAEREREWDKRDAERERERDKRDAERERERSKNRAERDRERAKDAREWRKRRDERERDRRGDRDHDEDDNRWGRSGRDGYNRDYYDPQDRAGRPRVRVHPVPSRRDLDRDGIRGDRDRDIDGDGVSNGRDRHPYDRRRR